MSRQMILVIQTAFLGDVLLTIPFLKSLRTFYPGAHLSFLARRAVAQPLLELGLIDQLYEIDKGQGASYGAVRNQIPPAVDLVFAVHESFRTKIFVSQLSARCKIGFEGFLSGWIFDECVEKPRKFPEVFRVLSLLQNCQPKFWSEVLDKVKIQSPYGLDEAMKLNFPVESYSMGLREQIHKVFEKSLGDRQEIGKIRSHQRCVLVFPGSVWATKRWTVEGFKMIIERLSEKYQVFLMGSRTEHNLCQEVKGQSLAINLAGQTSLMQTLFWMIQSNLVIGNDSGSAHLASVAEVPSLTIFGPTILEFGYRPWSNQATIIQPSQLACRPCGPHGHRQCPLGTHECMKSISPERVLQAAVNLLEP